MKNLLKKFMSIKHSTLQVANDFALIIILFLAILLGITGWIFFAYVILFIGIVLLVINLLLNRCPECKKFLWTTYRGCCKHCKKRID